MNFGKAIRKLRKEKGYTQKQLIKKTKVWNMTQLENNKSPFSIYTLQKLADGLDIHLMILLWNAITEDDVSEEKHEIFDVLKSGIDDAINNLFSEP